MSSVHVIRSKDFDTQVEVFGVPSGSTVGIYLKVSEDEFITVTGPDSDWIEELAERVKSTLIAWRMRAKVQSADCTYLRVDHVQAQEIIAAEPSSDQPDAEEERTARRVPVDTHAEKVKRAMRHGWIYALRQCEGYTTLARRNTSGDIYIARIPW